MLSATIKNNNCISEKLFSEYSLDCNNLLKDFCKAYIEQHWNFSTEKIFPISKKTLVVEQLEQELLEKKLPRVSVISIFCRGPFNRQLIHTDTYTQNNISKNYKTGFYIPILFEGSKMMWFDSSKGYNTVWIGRQSLSSKNSKIKNKLVQFPVYDENLPAIGEYDGNQSLVIRADIPHQAISTVYPKATLSIRLENNPDLFELLKL